MCQYHEVCVLTLSVWTSKCSTDRNPACLLYCAQSQLLRAAAAVAPRAVFVCGNTTTTAGLTVAVSKEGKGGDVAIEAGALVSVL